MALAAAAVVALLSGIGIILNSGPDKPDQAIESQDVGGQQLQADGPSDKPRGQTTGRPKSSPKGGSTTRATEDPATNPAATGQPTATATTDPDETTDPGSTEPATNPYDDPAGLCGDGYQVIDSKKLETGAGVLRGTIYLLYQAEGGMNCVVTIKANTLDKKTAMSAGLEVKGGSPVADKGSFQYYAGPVSAEAAGKCVRWGGTIGGLVFESGWSHCN